VSAGAGYRVQSRGAVPLSAVCVAKPGLPARPTNAAAQAQTRQIGGPARPCLLNRAVPVLSLRLPSTHAFLPSRRACGRRGPVRALCDLAS
jgi:hypothetical protein